MTPTPKQKQFLRFADKNGTKPIAWLGSVRAGKSIGAMMAVWRHMKKVPGDYFVSAASQLNRESNLMPNMRRIILADSDEVEEKTWGGRHLITPYGKIWFPLAADRSSERLIQGLTLHGGLSDEILLYPRNFVMQLVSRFSLDDPLWIMTANKSAPNHWIKTDWIDRELVSVFESGYEDNPHISDTARDWWNALIDGEYKKRMLDNEWVADLGMVGCPSVADKWPSEGNIVRSIWFDSARGSVIVTMMVGKGRVTVIQVDPFDTLEEKHHRMLIANKSDLMHRDRPAGCAFFAPDVSKYAAHLGKHADSLFIAKGCAGLVDEFKRWSWVQSGPTDITFKPDQTSPAVLATVQGFYHATQTSAPFMPEVRRAISC